MVQVGGEIPEEDRDQMKALADAAERSFSAELRIAVRFYLDHKESVK